MKVELYDSTYGNFEADVFARVRRATYGDDFGQNSWTTAEEYRRWAAWLVRAPEDHVLEVASGSGGPALRLASLTGARVTGIDVNAHGIAAANARAGDLGGRVRFERADATARLPFPDGTFDALLCIDSANHFPDRAAVLAEWARVLKAGGRLLWTDPVVITGPVTSEELATRSAVGAFLFVPEGGNERLMEGAGFALRTREDGSASAAEVARRWQDARALERAALVPVEGEERFAGLQAFLASVHRLTAERRLSRIAYLAER